MRKQALLILAVMTMAALPLHTQEAASLDKLSKIHQEYLKRDGKTTDVEAVLGPAPKIPEVPFASVRQILYPALVMKTVKSADGATSSLSL